MPTLGHIARIQARRDKLLANILTAAPDTSNRYIKYHDDPVGFARDCLQLWMTSKQEELLKSLLKPPYRTLGLSANEQGKTVTMAVAALWWHKTRGPAIILTTAPKFDQVKDLLWKEMRRLAKRLPEPTPFQPKACRIDRGPDDFVVGVTARDATSFQGHHGPNMLFLCDEATGIDPEFWEAIESMFSPPGHAWLACFNPTSTSAQVYFEFSRYESAVRKGSRRPWHVVTMSGLDHPNIAAELKGLEPPIPHAMRMEKFGRLLAQWSTLTGANPFLPVGHIDGPAPGDVVWPPVWAVEYCQRMNVQPRVYRPGPEAQARLLARFPDEGGSAIWGKGDWLSACRELPGQSPFDEPIDILPELGCDIAREGDDMTETHARCAYVSILHQIASKRPPHETAGHLKDLARWLSDWHNRRKSHLHPRCEPEHVPIKIDDDAAGGTIGGYLREAGFNAIQVSAASNANDTQYYPNRRSELWFVTAEMARRGELDLSRLDIDTREELQRQAITCTWKMDSEGRRVVEKKEDLKKRLKRSPDGCDAMNLAYYSVGPRGIGPSVAAVRVIPTASGWMHR